MKLHKKSKASTGTFQHRRSKIAPKQQKERVKGTEQRRDNLYAVDESRKHTTALNMDMHCA